MIFKLSSKILLFFEFIQSLQLQAIHDIMPLFCAPYKWIFEV
jgi:hypothetical protein